MHASQALTPSLQNPSMSSLRFARESIAHKWRSNSPVATLPMEADLLQTGHTHSTFQEALVEKGRGLQMLCQDSSGLQVVRT